MAQTPLWQFAAKLSLFELLTYKPIHDVHCVEVSIDDVPFYVRRFLAFGYKMVHTLEPLQKSELEQALFDFERKINVRAFFGCVLMLEINIENSARNELPGNYANL